MTRLRVVGVADTDSYVKWVAALLGGSPWDTSLAVLETPLTVSDRQLDTALAGSGMDAAAARRASLAAFEASLSGAPPDVVVIGARGPLVRVVARVVARCAPRAVIVTGLPGVAIPATRKALVYRAQCDLFVVHSHRERRAFRAVAAEKGFAQEFALATLPFAADRRRHSVGNPPDSAADRVPTSASVTGSPTLCTPSARDDLAFAARTGASVAAEGAPRAATGPVHNVGSSGTDDSEAPRTRPGTDDLPTLCPPATDLVFAAQALVPRGLADRERLAFLLRDTALADPDRRVVLKVRGVRGEQQTHAEIAELPDLVAALGPLPANFVVSAAPMQEALDTAAGLVTVSSTAAIEAIARGIPVIALDDFGVSRELINEVFEGSGLFGSGADVRARRFRHPDAAWVADSYLHDVAEDDWIARVTEAVGARRTGTRPARHPVAHRGGVLREAWDRRSVLGRHDRSALGAVAAIVGTPLRAVVRSAGRLRAIAAPPAGAVRSEPTALGVGSETPAPALT